MQGMISSGKVSFLRIGGEFGGDDAWLWETVISDVGYPEGGVMKDFIEMEHYVEAKQVLLSKRAADVLGDSVVGSRLLDGTLIVDTIMNKPLSRYSMFPVSKPENLEELNNEEMEAAFSVLESHIPEMARDYLSSRSEKFASDYRECSIVFFGFPTLLDNGDLAVVQSVFEVIQKLLHSTNGGFLQMRSDEKGFVLICAYGLPGRSSVNDAEKALKLALTVIEQLQEKEISAVAGVSTGTVFCTIVGSQRRAEYSVFGEKINLAARLMVAASKTSNYVLCDKETKSLVSFSREFTFITASHPQMKGIPMDVQLFSVTNGKVPASSNISSDIRNDIKDNIVKMFKQRLKTFIGQEDIMKVLLSKRQDLMHGIGSLLFLRGVTGVGKTVLAKEFLYREQRRKDRIFMSFYVDLGEKQSLENLFLSVLHDLKSLKVPRSLKSPKLKQFYRHIEIMENEMLSGNKIPKRVVQYLMAGLSEDLNVTYSTKEEIPIVEFSARFLAHALKCFVKIIGPCIIVLDQLWLATIHVWRFLELLSEDEIPIMFICCLRQTGLNRNTEFASKDDRKEFFMHIRSTIATEIIHDDCKILGIPVGKPSPLSDLFDIFQRLSKSKKATNIFISGFEEKDVALFMRNAFPEIELSAPMIEFVSINFGGHPASLVSFCEYLVDMDTKWDDHSSILTLYQSIIQQNHSSSGLWRITQTFFDIMSFETETTAKLISLMGTAIRLDVVVEAYPFPRDQKEILIDLLFFEALGVLKRNEQAKSATVWDFTSPMYRLVIQDNLTNSQQTELMGRIALVLERLYINSECCFNQAAFYWKESCKFNEVLHWRRALRAAAAFEDQACIDISQQKPKAAISSLISAVRLGRILLNGSIHFDDIKCIPAWRIASWQRSIAALLLLSDRQNEFTEAVKYCLRAFSLLNLPLPWADYSQCSAKKDVISSTAHALGRTLARRTSEDGSNTLEFLCLLSSRTTVEFAGNDENESIAEVQGMTTLFIPSEGSTREDEISAERVKVLFILMEAMEYFQKWDSDSLNYVQWMIKYLSQTTSTWKWVNALMDLEKRANILCTHASSDEFNISIRDIRVE